ncbi:Ig-like domain-containing protein, partial [Limnospira fusiformis NRMCF6962]
MDYGPVYTNARTPFSFNPVSNDTDPDEDPLTLERIRGTSDFALVTTSGNLINYTRLRDDTLTDEFSYFINDGQGGTATAMISVEWLPRPTDDPQTVRGGEFSDFLTGGAGNDTLIGLGGNDTLSGFGGNDSLVGGLGSDCLVGGTGNNIFAYETPDDGGGTAFNADSTGSIDEQIGTGLYDTIADFTRLGEAEGDAIALSRNFIPNTDRILLTVQTNISFNVLNGNNLFAYDDGSHTYIIYDGDGNNTTGDDSQILARLENITGEPPVAVDYGPVYTNARTQFSFNPVSNDTDPDEDPLTLESIRGTSDFALVTTSGNLINYTRLTNDTLTDEFSYFINDGQGGTATAMISVEWLPRPTDDPQTVTGGEFSDFLTGGAGNDTLIGLGGNDTLSGLGGNDSLVGGLGSDCLVGGTGNNIFAYETPDDGGGTAFNADSTGSINEQIGTGLYDTIADFTGLGETEGDAIALSSDLIPNTDRILLTVQTDISSNVLDGNNLFAYDDGSHTYIIYDGDGDNTTGDDSQILARLQNITG